MIWTWGQERLVHVMQIATIFLLNNTGYWPEALAQ